VTVSVVIVDCVDALVRHWSLCFNASTLYRTTYCTRYIDPKRSTKWLQKGGTTSTIRMNSGNRLLPVVLELRTPRTVLDFCMDTRTLGLVGLLYYY
jgi:hypothetical protein